MHGRDPSPVTAPPSTGPGAGTVLAALALTFVAASAVALAGVAVAPAAAAPVGPHGADAATAEECGSFDPPATVVAGESFTTTVNVTNRGDIPDSTTVEFLVDRDDDGTVDDPPIARANSGIVDPGETVSVEITVGAGRTTILGPGNYTVGVAVEGGPVQCTAPLELVEADPGIARFDADDDGRIEAPEVLDAVAAYNSGEEVGDRPVTAEDVLDVVAAYNSGRTV